FFFSSRRRHTRSKRDWSSDVCSSDLVRKVFILFPRVLSFFTLYNNTLEYMDYFAKKITNFYMTGFLKHYFMYIFLFFIFILGGRSEERRVGNDCSYWL